MGEKVRKADLGLVGNVCQRMEAAPGGGGFITCILEEWKRVQSGQILSDYNYPSTTRRPLWKCRPVIDVKIILTRRRKDGRGSRKFLFPAQKKTYFFYEKKSKKRDQVLENFEGLYAKTLPSLHRFRRRKYCIFSSTRPLSSFLNQKIRYFSKSTVKPLTCSV